MSPKDKTAKLYDWKFWARQSQLLPDGDWLYWLILAGRGNGKTRTGSETVRHWVNVEKFNYVNLIGATAEDVRAILIEGESGILAVCPPSERPRYVANARELRWPNGAKSLVFSAEEPDRLRGKQHSKLYCDEIASWRHPDTWDQALFGLRLGAKPQAVITTTPRPTPIIKDLIKDERTKLTTGSTYENKGNLAPAFIHKVITKYEGTRLGRQELHAEVLDELQGALWNRADLDADRRKPNQVPDLRRIVVAIDPAATSHKESNETGIICAGVGRVPGDDRDHGYLLDDVSGTYAPSEWARQALALFHARKAHMMVAEINQGGEMVQQTIHTQNPNVPYRGVHARQGKFTRAEPISALYEQHRIHHVGVFAQLEDQMCNFNPNIDMSKSKFSPDRMDAMVWAFFNLMVEPDDTGMLDFYRMEVEKLRAKRAALSAPQRGFG